jgi:wobble nucleotide-excising tRNase
MNVDFSNAYQEILFDNLISIIKQNFIFQTQIKLAEDKGKQKEEVEAKYNELIGKFNSVQGDLQQIESYKSKASQNLGAHEEKTRIQQALNDTMKKLSGFEKEVQNKQKEIDDLKEYIAKLEEIAPHSKLKKINPSAVKSVEGKPIETATKVDDGSTF